MRPLALLFCLALLGGTSPAVAGGPDAEVTAVFASVGDGYQRAKQADGSFKPERYVFGQGGHLGSATRDRSVDDTPFRSIARSIAPALARQNFINSLDPADTDLLVMVYWGETAPDARVAGGYGAGQTTIAPPPPPVKVIATGNQRAYIRVAAPPRQQQNLSDQGEFDVMASAQNRARERATAETAGLLGYSESLEAASARPTTVAYTDLLDEVEDSRYFVILRAYDFKVLTKERRQRLCWEVRLSIRARAQGFRESLAAMAIAGSSYFGRPSRGLVHKDAPTGEVLIGEPEYKEFLPADPK